MYGKLMHQSTLSTFAAAGVLIASSAAMAAPIEGGIAQSGNFQPLDTENGTAVGDLTSAGYILTDDTSIVVDEAVGDFGSLAQSDGYADFALDGSGVPISPFWTVSGGGQSFEFELRSFTVTSQTSDSIVIDGFGTVTSSDPSLDPTDAVYDASFNQTVEGEFVVETFSSSTLAEVPVPSSLALLGSGLLGLGLIARRRMGV